MPAFYYVQQTFKVDKWRGVPASQLKTVLRDDTPDMVSVLAASQMLEDLTPEEIRKVTYMGPLYFDFDSKDIAQAIAQTNRFMLKLSELRLNLNAIRIYASGGKGFHLELPEELFMEKPPAKGVLALPTVYREVALSLHVDTLDLNVYSGKRGRMWRTPNKARDNGKYKVQITLAELQAMTPDSYAQITSQARNAIQVDKPTLCVDLSVLYSTCALKVATKLKSQGSAKPDPLAYKKAKGISIEMLMDGEGLKDGVGFHAVALQVAIAAVTAGTPCEDMVAASKGLCERHQSDNARYEGVPARQAELRRLYDYVNDNPCYSFSVGALRSILSHSAPDLDGIPAVRKDIEDGIAAKDGFPDESDGPDEFDDVSAGVMLKPYGIYVKTKEGATRLSALSFKDVRLLWDADSSRLCGYEAEVLVNGIPSGKQTLELETFSSVQMFNRFAARLGHQFQGNENQIRGTMMRFVEQGKKSGAEFIARREGLDVVNIPKHSVERLRDPFMVWADNSGAVLDPATVGTDLKMCFQGFPKAEGLYQSDLYNAPNLVEWVQLEDNKEALRETLENLLTCQQPEVLGKMLGWFTAATYRMLFHKKYGQFPLLHINGGAGAGKSSMTKALAQMYYYTREARVLSPASTAFAIIESMSASASIPLVIDEYKPSEMPPGMHQKLTSAFRTAYNCGTTSKGGGSRDSDDYRTLHDTQLAAPTVFIGEAAEEQSAVAERVVQVTVVKAATVQANEWHVRSELWRRHPKHLGLLGKYIAAQAINSGGLDALGEEFEPLYAVARGKFLLSEADFSGQRGEAFNTKRNAKERSVFNYTVALFGLRKLRAIVEGIYEEEFEDLFAEMEASIYDRMGDLQTSTQPEWAKVLSMMSTMSYNKEGDSGTMLILGQDYDFCHKNGVDYIEIALRAVYVKYRGYMAKGKLIPLFNGEQPFLHAIKDITAFVSSSGSERLQRPNVYTFDIEELARQGVERFKGC